MNLEMQIDLHNSALSKEELIEIKGGLETDMCCETYIKGQQSAMFCDPTTTGTCPPDGDDFVYELVPCDECEV